MTILRMVGLLVTLVAIGIGVVAIRVDQARTTRHIQDLQFQKTDLQRKIWHQEMDLARLRSPQMIRERIERFGLAHNDSEDQ